jgi:hypothetical protein
MPVLRIAAEGVRAHQVLGQMQIDMRPCAKGRERAAVRIRQRQQDHVALQFTPDHL